MTEQKVTCRHCGYEKTLMLDDAAFVRWQMGELIQACFPRMPINDRELLISGTCGAYFDEMYGDKE